jgi:hypothetical protein
MSTHLSNRDLAEIWDWYYSWSNALTGVPELHKDDFKVLDKSIQDLFKHIKWQKNTIITIGDEVDMDKIKKRKRKSNKAENSRPKRTRLREGSL